ncbi:coiled-coil domain-containing protein 134-like isoform X1 [Schistocerca americana]|uniref:coiled-coil domain-containing protein 134-like isoform X1 n=2 Tax=Schistocerca americana TaxID=7009 RepID=UPI001F4FA1BB|nr:coiled-coil domain-containing protein 134-like isoform X1 [Schistocerca americana]XP_049763964.1 coiled-coil domain-containing protein 134-like isoform X1 [Schistocerca cancellata]XP_049789139.1 coiled-coil domain-containing protein 134-like isoform X1 [Schistocerca nitens]XP_049940487.1 coiled-coil domain-containing protein 134-like isoform X1 [Schistocerca serialis cubense]
MDVIISLLILSLVYVPLIIAVDPETNENKGPVDNQPFKNDDPDELLFRRLFKKRRAEQIQAVKGLLTMDSYEKQYRMISVIVDKLFNVIQNSRVTLESSGYVPGLSSFPKNEELLNALANILENTALFGDILLHLPEISTKILDSNNEWRVMFEWSLNFANQSQLLDSSTRKLIDLVSMELNITERHPDYINPYRRESRSSNTEEYVSQVPAKKKKKKKEIKRGPRLTGEL